MDEQTKQVLLSQVLKKKAFRDNRRLPRPASLDLVRYMLLCDALRDDALSPEAREHAVGAQ